jgi:alpha-L-fucosidase
MNRVTQLLPALVLAIWGAAAFAQGAGAGRTDAPRSMAEALKPDGADTRLDWWRAARFGLFIHWGPVSLRGTEIGWSRGCEVPVGEYDRLYERFNPEQFDAAAWVEVAKAAGARYVVFTSKHHDGFSMFDTKLSDYNIMHSPFKRDVVRELAAQCREQGLRFCLYYSIIDWYQPDYLPRGAGDTRPIAGADFERYVAFMKGQLRELLTGYGPLGVLWFDGQWEDHWTAERGRDLYRFCRALQPELIINNRVGKPANGADSAAELIGDYDTPEQQIGAFRTDRPWETCMTICQQWAWKPDDQLKSLSECVHALVRSAGGDGNFLLNVGPMPDGRIEPRQVERLREIGAWLARFGESIYDTRGGPYIGNEQLACTSRGRDVYLHLLKWPGSVVRLPALPAKIVAAAAVGGGTVKVSQTDAGVEVDISTASRDEIDTIVKFELDRPALGLTPIPLAGAAAQSQGVTGFDLGG